MIFLLHGLIMVFGFWYMNSIQLFTRRAFLMLALCAIAPPALLMVFVLEGYRRSWWHFLTTLAFFRFATSESMISGPLSLWTIIILGFCIGLPISVIACFYLVHVSSTFVLAMMAFTSIAYLS